MENIYWKKTVGTLIAGIWLYTIAGIVDSLIDAVDSIVNPIGLMDFINNLAESATGNTPLSGSDIFGGICTVLVIVGYFLFFRSMLRFIQMQKHEADKVSANKIKQSYIWLIVAMVLSFVPIVGWLLRAICLIVSYVKLLRAYKGLRDSNTWSPEAKEGAGLLHKAVIWSLVASIISIIPIFGSPIEGIITFILFFTVLRGWKHIQNGAPNLTEEEYATYQKKFRPVTPAEQLTYCILGVIGVRVLYWLLNLLVEYTVFMPFIMQLFIGDAELAEALLIAGSVGVSTSFVWDVIANICLLFIFIWMFRHKAICANVTNTIGGYWLLGTTIVFICWAFISAHTNGWSMYYYSGYAALDIRLFYDFAHLIGLILIVYKTTLPRKMKLTIGAYYPTLVLLRIGKSLVSTFILDKIDLPLYTLSIFVEIGTPIIFFIILFIGLRRLQNNNKQLVREETNMI